MTQAAELEPGLYIVATPIGNLGDITLRAIEVLRGCALIACEDTRVTGKLLHHLGISRSMRRHDEHSDEAVRHELLQLAGHSAVAVVSDAGTPLISDPGYELVRAAKEHGVPVVSVPGPCAAVAALSIAGLPSDRFLFAGFVPNKAARRAAWLAELADTQATLVFYETAARLVATLETFAQTMPGRTVAVARELTKLHEECRTGTAADLAAHYRARPPKGEIVLVLGPPPDEAMPADQIDALLRDALKGSSVSQAAAAVARATGADRRTLYARALELREE